MCIPDSEAALMDKQDLEIVNTLFGPLYTFKGDSISRDLKLYCAYQRNDLAMTQSFINKGDIVFDVGAHIGTFSIPIAKKVGGQGQVYAFEALEGNYRVLKKNIEFNLMESMITPAWAAVSDQGSYFKAQAGFLNNTGSTYLIAQESNQPEGIPSLVLDDYYRKIACRNCVDFIKIDTEGMEYRVLRGCEAILEKFKPCLLVEICPPFLMRFGHSARDIQTLLQKYGYHFFINLGPASSSSDSYVLGRLPNLYQPSGLFNLLAVHPDSNRYPKAYQGALATAFFFPKHHMKRICKRACRIRIDGSLKNDLSNLTRSIRFLLS
ncbi:FkbM family methyltransferase [Candidatus Parcubacteria bacterium]|nr:MAG: FkbM family methyltransferase [Candidatus Parcubacteria bacterium]